MLVAADGHDQPVEALLVQQLAQGIRLVGAAALDPGDVVLDHAAGHEHVEVPFLGQALAELVGLGEVDAVVDVDEREGDAPKKALRARATITVESFPVLHSAARLPNLACASRST